MNEHIGYARVKGNKMYFSTDAWERIHALAKKKKTTPRKLVISALRRYIKKEKVNGR
jgi:phage-related protein